jgi:hypothetical protein
MAGYEPFLAFIVALLVLVPIFLAIRWLGDIARAIVLFASGQKPRHQ